jgi:hypothetical protein
MARIVISNAYLSLVAQTWDRAIVLGPPLFRQERPSVKKSLAAIALTLILPFGIAKDIEKMIGEPAPKTKTRRANQ